MNVSRANFYLVNYTIVTAKLFIYSPNPNTTECQPDQLVLGNAARDTALELGIPRGAENTIKNFTK